MPTLADIGKLIYETPPYIEQYGKERAGVGRARGVYTVDHAHVRVRSTVPAPQLEHGGIASD
jgi:hypothetical protein